MTLFFKTNEIQVYRNRRIGSANRFNVSATGTVLLADITPASLERSEFENTAIGKTYIAYLESTDDVKEADEIVIIGGTFDGKRFSVKGVSTWAGSGIVDCKELTLVAQD